MINARPQIDYREQFRELARQHKPILKDAKKEEMDEERLVLNKFYGPDQGETMRLDMIMREGLVKQTEPKGEDSASKSSNSRKYKV